MYKGEELVKKKEKRGDSSLFKDLLVAAIRHDKIGTPGSLKKHIFFHVQSSFVVFPIQGKPSTFSSSFSKQLQYFEIYIYRRPQFLLKA